MEDVKFAEAKHIFIKAESIVAEFKEPVVAEHPDNKKYRDLINGNSECCICLETKEKHLTLITPCFHVLCVSCVSQMRAHNFIQNLYIDCPMCRFACRYLLAISNGVTGICGYCLASERFDSGPTHLTNKEHLRFEVSVNVMTYAICCNKKEEDYVKGLIKNRVTDEEQWKKVFTYTKYNRSLSPMKPMDVLKNADVINNLFLEIEKSHSEKTLYESSK